MRTLIVPCAGSRNINGVPLFLNQHPNGDLLVIKAIRGIFAENYDRIIVTVLKSVYERFEVKKRIDEANDRRYPIEIAVLPEETNGPAETVYNSIKIANISGELAVRDSHACISIKKDFRGNFLAGLDLTKYERPIENLRSKSFVTINEQGQVLDVVEKHFCSDIISTGLYGFKSVHDYVMAFQHLKDSNYSFDKLYISHIISYLIGYQQKVFHAEMVTEFEDWSTKTAWQKVQKSYATCLLDLDQLCESDGYVQDRIIKNLQRLSRRGTKFIGFTAKAHDISRIENSLKKNQVEILAVIGGCTHSKIRTLISSEAELNELILEV
ncbi:MAG: hypothetical protein NC094_09740 [Bacteroidales bacterium]|nr:hypothetical protein [Lachnoclostridium sp.]MCM1384129.1 hypothetical protein [Lachnoclostridium sp.]MCM1465689.1 hypothetical protein [Bacteroidales bacterium]